MRHEIPSDVRPNPTRPRGPVDVRVERPELAEGEEQEESQQLSERASETATGEAVRSTVTFAGLRDAMSSQPILVAVTENEDGSASEIISYDTLIDGTVLLISVRPEEASSPLELPRMGSLRRRSVHSHFGSADGAFAEDLAGLLFYDTVSETTAWKANPLSVDAFRGEMETASFYAAFDDPVLWFSATFEPTLSVQVSVAEGADVPPSKGSYTIAYMAPAEVEER